MKLGNGLELKGSLVEAHMTEETGAICSSLNQLHFLWTLSYFSAFKTETLHNCTFRIISFAQSFLKKLDTWNSTITLNLHVTCAKKKNSETLLKSNVKSFWFFLLLSISYKKFKFVIAKWFLGTDVYYLVPILQEGNKVQIRQPHFNFKS